MRADSAVGRFVNSTLMPYLVTFRGKTLSSSTAVDFASERTLVLVSVFAEDGRLAFDVERFLFK